MVDDPELFQLARSKHPDDLRRQKRFYDEQLPAKIYMNSLPPSRKRPDWGVDTPTTT